MHWVNSFFQTLYFLLGSAHTYDEAYRVVMNQLEERECALEEMERLGGMKLATLSHQFEHSAQVMTAVERRTVGTLIGAREEVAFLRLLASRLKPYCKYAHLDPHIAAQLAQREQWKYEFMIRIENQMYATGGIEPETLRSARMHPDYDSEIVPFMDQVRVAYKSDLPPPGLRSPVMAVARQVESERMRYLEHKPTEKLK